MRSFNPERALRKIQNGNKNKMIFSAIALLIILAIGSSYALYQVRYSKRIIYTKVAPFSNKDLILTFLVDGVKSEKIPAKDKGYYFDSIECESDEDATATWNYVTWELTSLTAKVPNKCNVKFTTTPYTLISQMEHIKITNPGIVMEDNTDDKNLRYVGKVPDNYIWFNCSDYDDLTQETAKEKCEKWRIIGLMNKMIVIDESTQEEILDQSLVKLIRENCLGNVQWDTHYSSIDPHGSNNWPSANLQGYLNNNYLNINDSGTWITADAAKDKNYKPISSATLEMIKKVKWNIGGSTSPQISVKQFYTAERGATTYYSRPSTWNGKIALMYPSDYGYATSGGTMDRTECLETSIYGWTGSSYRINCAENSWLLNTTYQWMLTPFVNSSGWVFGLDATGAVEGHGPHDNRPVFPTLYIDSNIELGSGNGSIESPYILVP